MNDQTPSHGTTSCDIGIVLVGLNARAYVEGCLRSLREADFASYSHRTVYVDNGSEDGTVEMVREQFPEVMAVANATNIGYCPAANQGARLVECEYLAFLNDDTVVLGDALARLAQVLDERPSVAQVGARLFYADMTDQWSGRSFPSPLNAIFSRGSVWHRLVPDLPILRRYMKKEELLGEEPFEVDWVSAAGTMIRSSDFWAVGGFAEDYYYWHEAVFSSRLARRQRATYLHPGAHIIHYEGKGSGARPYPVQKFHIKNFHQGAYRFYCEHHGLGPYNPLRWLTLMGLYGCQLAALSRAKWQQLYST